MSRDGNPAGPTPRTKTMNAERILRSIRQHPALYGERGESKEKQAVRIRDKAKARLAPQWAERAAEQRHAAGLRMLQTFA